MVGMLNRKALVAFQLSATRDVLAVQLRFLIADIDNQIAALHSSADDIERLRINEAVDTWLSPKDQAIQAGRPTVEHRRRENPPALQRRKPKRHERLSRDRQLTQLGKARAAASSMLDRIADPSQAMDLASVRLLLTTSHAFSDAAGPALERDAARQQGTRKGAAITHGHDHAVHQEWKEVWAQHPEWTKVKCVDAIWMNGQADSKKPLTWTMAQIRQGLVCRKCPAVRRSPLAKRTPL